ncbi:MAG: exodeoxyribonuclease VII large subunit [Deltaproteobacteria bacterium]|nr:exodeoxyribonuclease VII large subunit [Deltaproteobacteria bacterium]MBI2540390.1 exodeoxyribonuclease VII large subunit [Deltaproteobacteria bacterium]
MPLFSEERAFLTVSELTQIIKGTLERELEPCWVVGEISNFRIPPSGHLYFTLKDDKSQISAVMFRRQGQGLGFQPENGMEVFCFGRVSVYPVRGDLQLYVESMEPKGRGALYLAFEQLKKRLAEEGLFAVERKRPLPFLPASIGLVTSLQGAALRDMLRILGDRFPDRRIVIRPVKVQGDGAAAEIAGAVTELGRSGEVEVMIVGRGGGSLEDLWAFNEEVVARAIFAAGVPVISAVGHEIDFTIADFVADHRAPTPTAAAEMVVPRKADLMERVEELRGRLLREIQGRLDQEREAWAGLARRLADPRRRLQENQMRLDELSLALGRRFQDHLDRLKSRLTQGVGRLSSLSPLAVLERGYSIAHKMPEGLIIKDSAPLKIGDLLRITFARGKSLCRVEEKE